MDKKTKQLIKIMKEDYNADLSKEEAQELGSVLIGLAKCLVKDEDELSYK